jgi:hypothetical protein
MEASIDQSASGLGTGWELRTFLPFALAVRLASADRPPIAHHSDTFGVFCSDCFLKFVLQPSQYLHHHTCCSKWSQYVLMQSVSDVSVRLLQMKVP